MRGVGLREIFRRGGGIVELRADSGEWTEAGGEATGARTEVENNKNSASGETAAKLISESKKADAKVADLTAALKAFNSSDEAIKQLAGMVKALAANKDMSQLQTLQAQYGADISTLKTAISFTVRMHRTWDR